jgi:hypothetical protein
MLEVVTLPSSVRVIDYQAFDCGIFLKTLYINGDIIKCHRFSIKTESLETVYYHGTKEVSKLFHEITPRVIVCSNYKGDQFSGITPERVGYCQPQRDISCMKRCQSSRSKICVLLLVLSK